MRFSHTENVKPTRLRVHRGIRCLAMALSEAVRVKIDLETRGRLEALGEATDRSVSSVIRIAIREYLAAHDATQTLSEASAEAAA